MLTVEHCIGRAERLRLVLLTTNDPSGVARLRRCIEKYRALGTEKQQAALSPAVDALLQKDEQRRN
jgi:hypothetical protein